MEHYIESKYQCCEIQKRSWSGMLEETKGESFPSTIEAIQSEKKAAFAHYERLLEALNKVEDKEFVENERVNMLEKMVELAEFETHETIQKYANEVDESDVEIGNNLGVKNFVVRRDLSHINDVYDVINQLYQTWTSARWIAIMGPGAAVNDDIYMIMPGSIQEQTPVELIYFGKDVTEISDYFSSGKRDALTVVCFHAESKCSKIGEAAFSSASLLKEIKIPDSVTEIGGGCFYSSGLEEVTLGANIKTLGANSFANCNNLKEITFKYNSGLTIHQEAFADLPELDTVKLEIEPPVTPGDWVPIIDGVFDSCEKLIEMSESWKKQIDSLRADTGKYTDISDVTLYVAFQNQFGINEAGLASKLPGGDFMGFFRGFAPTL